MILYLPDLARVSSIVGTNASTAAPTTVVTGGNPEINVTLIDFCACAAPPNMVNVVARAVDMSAFEARCLELTAEKDAWNAHNVKYVTAVLEDAKRVSPTWRPHVLSSVVHWQHGTRAREGSLARSARGG